MELHLRGTRLPEREPVELWTDNGRISLRPVAGAQTLVARGFVLPGLIDAHTHPGAPARTSRWTRRSCARICWLTATPG